MAILEAPVVLKGHSSGKPCEQQDWLETIGVKFGKDLVDRLLVLHLVFNGRKLGGVHLVSEHGCTEGLRGRSAREAEAVLAQSLLI